MPNLMNSNYGLTKAALKEKISQASPTVGLFSPSGNQNSYKAEFEEKLMTLITTASTIQPNPSDAELQPIFIQLDLLMTKLVSFPISLRKDSRV
ncbi:hypothetical protein PtA15_2A294 [Puccinia triticina]|uniref:Uncharacterized protein n=1 Tax=Puccinia triticina TaxID=208348 RepID=A0ABY7C9Y2_9BASI|nr:uncharacterized protein PtA15_2A294 [Puccinia triticina]WAQ81981.1 hypothetical protein PtA15_2A294 [Puccinia triticina]WAR52862.1 hypothetical protein PtB15_2B290 [Puccinia triticina]